MRGGHDGGGHLTHVCQQVSRPDPERQSEPLQHGNGRVADARAVLRDASCEARGSAGIDSKQLLDSPLLVCTERGAYLHQVDDIQTPLAKLVF